MPAPDRMGRDNRFTQVLALLEQPSKFEGYKQVDRRSRSPSIHEDVSLVEEKKGARGSIELRVQVNNDEEMRQVKALLRRVEGVRSVETEMLRKKVTVYGRNLSYTSVYRVLEDAGINVGPADPNQSSTDTDHTSIFTTSSGSSLRTKGDSPSPPSIYHQSGWHDGSTSNRAGDDDDGDGGGDHDDIPCSGIKNYRDYTQYSYRPW